MKQQYILTDHAIQRYESRTNKSKQNTKHRMLRDLHATRNKKLVKINKILHVFYTQPSTNVREFIMEEKNGKYIVTTVINRNRHDSEIAYRNRLKQKKEFEKNSKGDY